MASPTKTGGSTHEIVARFDQVCWKCRGKCREGSRIRWDKSTSLVEHVECPPIFTPAEDVYRPPPVGPDLWKAYCQAIAEITKDTAEEKKAKEPPQGSFVCSSCKMEWTCYANLEGLKHIAMSNRCGGTWGKQAV